MDLPDLPQHGFGISQFDPQRPGVAGLSVALGDLQALTRHDRVPCIDGSFPVEEYGGDYVWNRILYPSDGRDEPTYGTERTRLLSGASGELDVAMSRTNSSFHSSLHPNPGLVVQAGQHLDIKYLTHWQTHVLRALPPVFHELTTMLQEYQAMKNAALAIAACNLGRSLSEAQVERLSEDRLLTSYRPSREHQHHSQGYYISAIRDLANLPASYYISHAISTLAVMLLFSYIEIGTGSFRGFSLHIHGAEKLISAQLSSLSLNATGRKLLGVWTRLRSYQWCQQLPLSWADFQRSLRLLSSGDAILWVYEMRRESIIQIFAESYHLNCRSLLARVPHSIVYGDGEDSGSLFLGKEVCADQLRRRRDLLTKWHSMLKLHDLPVESFSTRRFETCAWEESELSVEPLRFQCHEAAMNYAYYVSSQILQDVHFLESVPFDGMNGVSGGIGTISPWALLLLRVAAGLDHRACAQENTYTVGVTTLLMTCALHGRSLLVGKWIERWLGKFRALSIFEEGCVPILQALDILRTVNSERAGGRDIFFLFDGDSGDNLRLDSYSCQNITSLNVYGRDRVTSQYFQARIPIQTSQPL